MNTFEVVYQGNLEGAQPLQNLHIPLSFEGEKARQG